MGKKNTAVDANLVAEIESIGSEAREGFDLRARLSGASRVRKEVTIYTDAAAGAELGVAFDATLPGGIKTGQRVREGLLGRLDELQAESATLLKHFDALEESGLEASEEDAERAKRIKSDISKVRADIDSTKERLKGSSLTFSLISIPDVVKRVAQRDARKALGLKAKGIPEARQEEYNLEYTAQILSASTEKWVDHQDETAHTALSVDDARTLRDYLPEGQFDRLDRACVELSFKAAISDASTDDPDF